jgi:hypothetical protein
MMFRAGPGGGIESGFEPKIREVCSGTSGNIHTYDLCVVHFIVIGLYLII